MNVPPFSQEPEIGVGSVFVPRRCLCLHSGDVCLYSGDVCLYSGDVCLYSGDVCLLLGDPMLADVVATCDQVALLY